MDSPDITHPDIAKEETCAIRQDAFCKVHRKFVTVRTPFFAPFFALSNQTNYLYFETPCN
ncbi:hypothetical protein [Herbaspirillum sp. C9C3]|uniref:hypothetical protein n=1 Tax=Herbaspirillum sp. C9C3 TaxID=2735271 RepID=UPI00158471A2|nr:hypothetical protein [Herbaspirillum sp. C9C3]NUT63741.1 hypothetical protein [Herbaspirillum sp. C9C3]